MSAVSTLQRRQTDAENLESGMRCRVHFADSDQNVYKELRIQELPPPEGMDMNEFRYNALQACEDLFCIA